MDIYMSCWMIERKSNPTTIDLINTYRSMNT